MHNFKVSEELQELMKKLSKKDKSLYEQLLKKIDEIVNCYDVEHYKNLKYNMKDSKRVHIGHFALVFNLNKRNNLISFEDFNHYDNIYLKRF